MNLILMILRLVLSVLFPSRRDGLSLAARADGRLQHVPQSPWAWLLGEPTGRRARRRTGAPNVRASGLRPRPSPNSGDGS
jgi:hypothetical protein